MKIKVLASQWRQGVVTPNGTEIELTDEQVAEIASERVEIKRDTFMVLFKELENKLDEKDLIIANGEKQNAKLTAVIKTLSDDIIKLQQLPDMFAPVEVTTDEADGIEKYKRGNSGTAYDNVHSYLMNVLDRAFVREDANRLARAYLNGYTIKQEKRYRVELPIERLGMNGSIGLKMFTLKSGEMETNVLTESQINLIDHRLMAFAVEVSDD